MPTTARCLIITALGLCGALLPSAWAQLPAGPAFSNSLGIEFVRIEPGEFTMGVGATPLPVALHEEEQHRINGDFDEQPNHPVTISAAFYMATVEVTNQVFEQFDPTHAALRGKLGFSSNDDEAVVFVSWDQAKAFCEWLSAKENLPYRLPTEAEWEYACRAGTTTHFNTGDDLPVVYQKSQIETWYPDPMRVTNFPADYAPELVSLAVGKTPANPWGLFDMHGNVEEWCSDWYGPYVADAQTDPVGRESGLFRVTRGGSHGTKVYYLRSANRMGTLPEERNWLIGFRVVLGAPPATTPLAAVGPEPFQRNVSQAIPPNLKDGPDPTQPYFQSPRIYVKIPAGSMGPMFSNHNHDPALVECPNGDLLAIWYTTVRERGRELGLVASRLPFGQTEWQEASLFYDAPDRNDHAPAAWYDEDGTIYCFVGLSAAATWGNLATVMLTSTDNGVTWSTPRIIVPEHGARHQPVESVFRTRGGAIVVPCDAVSTGSGGTALQISTDKGLTWSDPGGTIAGIHGGVVELANGNLMGLGRSDNVDGMMPKSISADMGKTWTYSASPFQPVGGGQRLVLFRLDEGPLFLASFCTEEMMTDGAGNQSACTGLFVALSYDDGATWPVKRLVTDGSGNQVQSTNGELFTMSATTAEPRGYMSGTQTADGVVQLISSKQHYAFNRAWIVNSADSDADGQLDWEEANLHGANATSK